MTVVTAHADPEAAAVRELVEDLAIASAAAVEQLEPEVDLSNAELIVDLTSRDQHVRVVQEALAAVDNHWRLANAIFDAPRDVEWEGLQQLIDRVPAGLWIVDAAQGSLFVRMRDEFRKSPLQTLAALAAIAAFLNGMDLLVDRPDGQTRYTIQVPEVSSDTREVIEHRIKLPNGSSVTIEARAASTNESAIVRIRPVPHMRPPPKRRPPEEAKWLKGTLPEKMPVDVPLPEGAFYLDVLPGEAGFPRVYEVNEAASRSVRRLIWSLQTHLVDIASDSAPSGVTLVSLRTGSASDTERLDSWLVARGAVALGTSTSRPQPARTRG